MKLHWNGSCRVYRPGLCSAASELGCVTVSSTSLGSVVTAIVPPVAPLPPPATAKIHSPDEAVQSSPSELVNTWDDVMSYSQQYWACSRYFRVHIVPWKSLPETTQPSILGWMMKWYLSASGEHVISSSILSVVSLTSRNIAWWRVEVDSFQHRLWRKFLIPCTRNCFLFITVLHLQLYYY